MAVHRRASESDLLFDPTELCMELAGLDPTQLETLGNRLVTLIASYLHTDRVSLTLFNSSTGEIVGGWAVGINVDPAEWNISRKVLDIVRNERRPLLAYDLRELPEVLSPWAATYRTDACAVFPLVVGNRVIGVLSLSNLSTQHLMQMENSSALNDLFISQVRQLALLLHPGGGEMNAAEPVTTDELTLLGSLIDKLEHSMDIRNVFAVFSEVLSVYMPVDLLAVIHDKMHGRQNGVICVQRPIHLSEVRTLFSNLSHQWQRRHKRSPILNIEDAELTGRELIQEAGSCPFELRLRGCETFPIFIDNDLFALVCIATDDATLADRRRLRMFSILAHHLLLHVKKAILMMQNQEMQTVDALTGLYNERHFFQMMEREFDRAARYNVPLTLLFLDVDHFKDVNETYGFETGDMLLQEVSRIIVENMRSTDFVGRYSGERFVVVLPETHYKNSEIMANRLRRYIENNSFFIPNTNVFIKVTVSIGVASYLEHKPSSLAQFIEFADTALYFAKRNGRNQVVGYSYVINLMMGNSGHES